MRKHSVVSLSLVGLAVLGVAVVACENKHEAEEKRAATGNLGASSSIADLMKARDLSEADVEAALKTYMPSGKVHRVEDWGRRQLAYMIQKLAKAHYLCLNIECGHETLTELETGFRFNDAVLRHLTVSRDKAETTPSIMMKAVEREEARKERHEAAA